MGNKLLACLFFAVWTLRVGAQHTDTPSETPLPACTSVEESRCNEALGCEEVPFLLTNTRYSLDNLLCIDNDLSTPFRLSGCPIGYFDQNINGVCSSSVQNGTDLLLTPSELVPGLHSFECLVSSSPSVSVFNYAVIGNDNLPFRDMQVYVNAVLLEGQNGTNLAFDLGDNVTIFILAIGNVSVIGADDERFSCVTDFPCNEQTRNEVANRYLECSLRTPANTSDDGRTLTIFLNSTSGTRTELATITLSMNERPLPPPSANDGSHTTSATASMTTAVVTSSTTASTTTTSTTTSTATSTTTTAINPTVTQSFMDTMIVPVTTSTATMATATVSEPQVTFSVDHATSTDHNAMPTSSATDKAPNEHPTFPGTLVAVITGSVSGCIVLFVVMAVLYCKCKRTRSRVSKKSVEAIPIPHACKVLSFSCPHCDKLDQKIKASGYTIQKLPKNQSTDVYKQDLEICKDKNISVIMCGHPECQAPCWLESSPVPENWNILQLHMAGDGDEIPLGHNQKIKVIKCASAEDSMPVDEVLDWLDGVSRRGSITSLDGQRFSELSKEINRGVQLLVERTDVIIEKQDQTITTVNALHIDARE